MEIMNNKEIDKRYKEIQESFFSDMLKSVPEDLRQELEKEVTRYKMLHQDTGGTK